MVLRIILYVVLTFFMSVAGSVTGIGGGVILKPVLDALGHYDIAVIGVLSSTSVLSMSIVSVIKRLLRERKIRKEAAEYLTGHPGEVTAPVSDEGTVSVSYTLELGIGSFAGGITGQFLFGLFLKMFDGAIVKIIQNVILIAVIILVLVYMRIKRRINPLRLMNPAWYIIAGIFLGIIAAFLGIGGGPLNMVVIMFLFGLPIKPAAYYSIVTVLFSQLAKLMTLVITTGIPEANYLVLPFMVAMGAAGALTGAVISAKMSGKRIELIFNILQIIIIGLCGYNIISYFV